MRNLYNLPKKVEFCSKCVYSNQLPSSIPEYLHKPSREGAKYINFRKHFFSSFCKFGELIDGGFVINGATLFSFITSFLNADCHIKILFCNPALDNSLIAP